MTIKAIIFDLGGVVVELDFSRFFKDVIEISPLNTPNSSLLLEFWRQSDIYHQGKITNEEFYSQACELLQTCALNQEQFFDSFNSVISHIKEELLTLIKNLKEQNNIKLLCLSNVNSSHWHYLLEQNKEIVEFFDELILSFEVHMTKPDPRLFKLAIQKAGCKPEEIVFIDDGLNNIRSARELGIIGIKFTYLEDLISELKSLKINI
ncbi:MAG: HAD family hydrolase [Candidatus Hodarchaeota archaeon]